MSEPALNFQDEEQAQRLTIFVGAEGMKMLERALSGCYPQDWKEGGRVNVRDVAVRAYRVGRAFGLTAEDLDLVLGWLSDVWNMGRTYDHENSATSMEVSASLSLASSGPYGIGGKVISQSSAERRNLFDLEDLEQES